MSSLLSFEANNPLLQFMNSHTESKASSSIASNSIFANGLAILSSAFRPHRQMQRYMLCTRPAADKPMKGRSIPDGVSFFSIMLLLQILQYSL